MCYCTNLFAPSSRLPQRSPTLETCFSPVPTQLRQHFSWSGLGSRRSQSPCSITWPLECPIQIGSTPPRPINFHLWINFEQVAKLFHSWRAYIPSSGSSLRSSPALDDIPWKGVAQVRLWYMTTWAHFGTTAQIYLLQKVERIYSRPPLVQIQLSMAWCHWLQWPLTWGPIDFSKIRCRRQKIITYSVFTHLNTVVIYLTVVNWEVKISKPTPKLRSSRFITIDARYVTFKLAPIKRCQTGDMIFN